MARNKKDPGKLLSSAVMLFYFSAFLLIACKDYAWQGFALALAVPAMIWIGTNLLPRLFPSDRLLLSLTNFLCALGVLVLYSTEPEYAYNQAMYYGVGIAAMIVCVWIVRLIRSWRVPVLLLMPVSLVLLTLPMLIALAPMLLFSIVMMLALLHLVDHVIANRQSPLRQLGKRKGRRRYKP